MTLIMGLFGVAFILLTFGYIAWEQRNRLIQRDEEDIASNAFFLADHAARLFEVTDLTLKQTIDTVEGLSWDDIQASERLWHQLRAVQEALPYVDNVWLNDANGKLRLTTAEFPTPDSNVSGRDAFSVQARADQGLFVGEPIIGTVTKEPTFLISRRLQSRDGRFDGIVSVTVVLSYFNDYWGKLRLPKGSRVTLLRASDARVIAQYPPPSDGLTFFPIDKSAFDQAAARDSMAGSYVFSSAGEERIGGYHRIGDLPLYINVSMPENAYRGPWTVQMRLYGAFALIALIALLALTSLAYEQFNEQAATEALLQREVTLRTGELKAETAALEILDRTGRVLAAELDIERIVENVVEAAVLLTGAQTGVFFAGVDSVSPNEDGQPGVHYGHYAPGGPGISFADLAADKICEEVFEHGRTLRIGDISVDPDHKRHLKEGSSQERPGIRSVLAVPVSSRAGKTYGVLLFAHEKAEAFTERAERLVTGLAAQAAIALENGRLYQEAQHEIEERRQAQNQQSFLIRELHHRVKNTLATVQAVVGATARSTSSIEEFYKAFVGRIISLANTHSLLTEALWQTAPLREILEKELIPYNDARGERIELEGPDVKLPSEIAVPIGMAIHELTTNAAKYGALSMRSGKVSVMWSVHGEGDDKRLSLSWVESGGPRVAAKPGKQGFGSRLLHRVLTTQLNAEVQVDYDPTGLRVSIDAPIKSTASLSPPV